MQPLVESSLLFATGPVPGVWEQLNAVVQALGGLLIAIAQLILPWTPLLLWIAFWLFAVNWRQLYPVLMRGGFIGVVLMALIVILTWASIAEPAGGVHQLFGLRVNNLFGKTIYVTGLWLIAAVCGSVQLNSRWSPGCCNKAE